MYKLQKSVVKYIRKYFFTERVANSCNYLLSVVVKAPSS